MIDTETPESPGWYLNFLLTELHNRRVGRRGSYKWTRDQVASSKVRPPLLLLNDYLHGDPPLSEDIHGGWAAPFRQFVRMGRLNVADLLVGSTGNRMGVRDFRTSAAQDELGDAEARSIMRHNKLKLVARDVHDYMLGLGDGYTLTTPPADGEDYSRITAESPLQCITYEDPLTGQTTMGAKLFRDEMLDVDWAYLYVPGEVYVAVLEGPTSIKDRGNWRMSTKWEWVEDKFTDVPGGTIPLTRFRNARGKGEFEAHLNHLDRINDKLFNEWFIGKIQAFRQRAIKGLPDFEDRIVDGKKVQEEIDYTGMFTSSPDALWRIPADAEMWESTPVSLDPLVNSIQKELQWLAAVTRRPLHTITPDAANGSAEGASTMKEEHIYDVEDRRDRAEGGWVETMSKAFLYQGEDDRSDVTQLEVIWGPVERYSLGEKAEASAKADKLPREIIWRDIWQYPPAEIPALRELSGRDLLFQAPGQPARPGTTAVVPAAPAPAAPADQPQG